MLQPLLLEKVSDDSQKADGLSSLCDRNLTYTIQLVEALQAYLATKGLDFHIPLVKITDSGIVFCEWQWSQTVLRLKIHEPGVLSYTVIDDDDEVVGVATANEVASLLLRHCVGKSNA